jgi:hypothetical protein
MCFAYCLFTKIFFSYFQQVRIQALQCVGEMVHLSPVAVQPHKIQIINGLKPALDDRKRLVRKQAVAACNAW